MKKNLLKSSIVAAGALSMIAAPIATIACGKTVTEIKTGRNLKMLYNQTKNTSAYRFDQSFSYGTVASDIETSSTMAVLVRTASNIENTKFNKESGTYFEYFKLELASGILVTPSDSSERVLFDSDDYGTKGVSTNPKSINSTNFKTALENASAIEFVIREGIEWVDKTGNSKKDSAGNAYVVTAEDFYYGIYRTGLTNNADRNKSYSDSNPFGGFGTRASNESETDFSNSNKLRSENIGKEINYQAIQSASGGFTNAYLYDMFNVQNPAEMVELVGGKPAMIGSYESKDTVKFAQKSDLETDAKADFWNAFTNLVLEKYDFVAAPSGFIKDVSSKESTVGSITLPEGKAKEFGAFTYGTKLDNTLFASPYYVSTDAATEVLFKKNTKYNVGDWVESSTNIESIKLEYITVSDYGTQLFNRYQNGDAYILPLSQLDDSQFQKVVRNGKKYGVRRIDPVISTKFAGPDNLSGDMFPIMLPYAGQSKYLFNDGFAKMYYGSTLADITAGNMKISDYLKPHAVAFRSQLTALINWYGQSVVLSPRGDYELWMPYLPTDVTINGKETTDDAKKEKFFGKPADTKNPRTRKGYTEELNAVQYYELNAANELSPKSISVKENRDKYNATGVTNIVTKLQSNDFATIKTSILKLIEDHAGGSKVTFDFINRDAALSSPQENALKYFADVINSVDTNKLTATFSKQTDFNVGIRPSLTGENGSWFQFHGWGPDFDGAATWATGYSRERFGLAATAIAMHNLGGNAAFDRLTDYGSKLATEINTAMNEYFADVDKNDGNDIAGFYNSVDDIKDIKNVHTINLSSSNLISTSLFKDYNNGTPDDTSDDANATQRVKIDEAKSHFYKTVANIDQSLQDIYTNAQWIDLFTEYQSLTGKTFGYRETVISNKTDGVRYVWSTNLDRIVLLSGISYLSDWKIK